MVPRIPALQGDAMRRHIVVFGAEYAGGSTRRQSQNLTHGSDCGEHRRLLMRRAPGDLGGVAGKSPGAQAGGESGGRPTPAGRAEQLVSAAAMLAVPKTGVFSKWQFAFESARRRPQRRSETCLLSKEMRSSTLRMGSDIAITQ